MLCNNSKAASTLSEMFNLKRRLIRSLKLILVTLFLSCWPGPLKRYYIDTLKEFYVIIIIEKNIKTVHYTGNKLVLYNIIRI